MVVSIDRCVSCEASVHTKTLACKVGVENNLDSITATQMFCF